MIGIKSILPLVAILWLASCTPLNQTPSGTRGETGSGRIAFCTLLARGTGGAISDIRLEEFRLADGTIKQPGRNNFHHPLQVTLEDANGKPSQNFLIANPLIEVYEYADDNGQLNLHTARLDSAQFHLRFLWTSNTEQLRFTSLPGGPVSLNILIKLAK